MRLSTPPLSLYVHFPWCVRKCPYCDFNSYTLHGELAETKYVEALERDLEAQAVDVGSREVVSIFFGGGTPSLFSPDSIARVLAAARRYLNVALDAEVTMEANPGAVEHGLFGEYRAAGLTRVSLGAQSFDSQRLRALGRIHSPDETRRAAAELHAAGLDNFNLDLMYALPGQTVAGAISDLEEALALAPAHLSHYQLTIEPGTVFAGQPPELPDEDVAADMLTACDERLDRAGFRQYEVSAYARDGRRCRHNLNYWEFGDYLGVGAGAHGKLTFPDTGVIVRTVQPREPRRYMAALGPLASGLGGLRQATGAAVLRQSAGAAGVGAALRQSGAAGLWEADGAAGLRVASGAPDATGRTDRVIPAEELPFEFMLNALRLVDGFEAGLFRERTGLAWETIAPKMAALVAEGLLERRGTCYGPSPRGLQFLNDVLVRFVTESTKTTGAFGLSTAL